VVDDVAERCELLRSLHVPGDPLVLPNAWDVASARAVVAAGFPVVATTSAGVAGALGYEDHEGAPAAEMLAAAARIARGVDVPVTVDAEAGYGLAPDELVRALRDAGAAGCNLEDTDHTTGRLHDVRKHADWLRAVRAAADATGYPLVVNARVDVFLSGGGQRELVPEALERATAYLEAGADCVYPILIAEESALATLMAETTGAVNVLATDAAPSPERLAELGVARISHGAYLYRETMKAFEHRLESLRQKGAR
jgi:2-methylisocitrate lyase-like PEP mutase family enzyme